jgi:ubiquitin C-terminal hydrolase
VDVLESGHEDESANHTIRMKISVAPPILVLHLKRFAMDNKGKLNKLTTEVNFPTQLDITEFCDPKCKVRLNND